MDKLVKLPDGTQLTVGSHQVEILQYLSEGGFAHIYKVQIDPPEEGTDIACLKRVIIPDKTGLDQLRKEVEVMKRLRHSRCVVKYFDSHAERLDSGGYQVLVLMELCPNKSLLDLMNAKIKTKLLEPEILAIMRDISIAVYEMHKVKMIHRDIKIENVLLDVNCRYKLADFGSTSGPIKPPQTPQELQALSHEITYQTTPQYRAPEMIDLYRGFPIDEKADIWALGCFLYKLCYYTTPFEANGEIAILHASYQFPPAPVYSGDLKNLIIILLQENPLMRPNIVQVVQLVASLLKVDFSGLAVDDIYKAGPYNFQALHEYQSQKQNEMMRQQQMYYEQQQGQVQPHDKGGAPTGQPVQVPPGAVAAQASQATQGTDRSQKTGKSERSSQKSTDRLDETGKSTDKEGAAETEFVDPEVESDSSDLDVSLGDYEDNVEERYPSLENIIGTETPKSGATSVKSSTNTEATSAPYPKSLNPEGLEVNSGYNSSVKQSPFPQAGFAPEMSYPQQPVVLPPHELQQLTPDQLLQYNYQHQAYHYQMNQWIYMQQQKQQKQYQPQQPQPQQPSHRSNKSSFDIARKFDSMDRSTSFNYADKEAWEQLQSNVNADAGKLADDIFASKSRSPVEATEPQKTSQSVKSEPAPYKSEPEESDSDEPDTEGGNQPEPVQSNEASEPAPVDLMTPTNLQLLDGEDKETEEEAPPKPQRPKSYVEAKSYVDTREGSKILSQGSSQPLSSPAIPTSSSFSKNNNPFPVQKQDDRDFKFPQSIDSSKTSETPKSSNPWGDYTGSQTPKPQLESLHQRMSSLNVKDTPTQSRKPSNEQPDLIDLDLEEVEGTKTRDSTTSTPVLAPSEVYPSGLTESHNTDSLIDLDLESKGIESKKVRGPEKPHFKKRVSAIPNPSDFKVQEEVIDWASDDEDPEHGSKMSRVSIRNSLKNSRKSGEHKRSESASSDHRNRISRLMLNN